MALNQHTISTVNLVHAEPAKVQFSLVNAIYHFLHHSCAVLIEEHQACWYMYEEIKTTESGSGRD